MNHARPSRGSMPPSARDTTTRNKLQPSTLALVELYYPQLLRERILRCCRAQLAGRYMRTCRHALCPACSSIESHKIAKAQHERFQRCTPPGKNPRLAHEVYTLPPYLRARVKTPEGFRAWAKATRDTIREIHDAPVAGVMNLHPIGDEDLLTFHPHWDVVLNGFLLNDAGRPVEHRPRHIHYDDARAIYTRHLVKAFGLLPIEEPRAVSIYLDRKDGTFHTSRRKTWHMVRYSARHIYQPHFAWLNERGTGGDWWYKPHKSAASATAYEGRDVMANLLAQQAFLRQYKRRIWFGYMQNRIVNASAERFAATKRPNGGESA